MDEAFHAPSAFFIRSPSGFERFGLACRLGRRSGYAGSSTGRPHPLVDAENDRKSIEKMPIFGRFTTHLQLLQKNKFENREFLKAEVAGSMGLSAVIARILSHFY